MILALRKSLDPKTWVFCILKLESVNNSVYLLLVKRDLTIASQKQS